jgi:hypothetical protein
LRQRVAAEPAGRLAHVAAAGHENHLLDEGVLHPVKELRVTLLRPPLAALQRRQVVHLIRTLPCGSRAHWLAGSLAEIS